MGDTHVGLQASLMYPGPQSCVRALNQTKTTMIFITSCGKGRRDVRVHVVHDQGDPGGRHPGENWQIVNQRLDVEVALVDPDRSCRPQADR